MDVEMEREPEYSQLRPPDVVSKKLPWDHLFELETDVPRTTGQSASLEISSNLFDVRRDGLADKGQGKDVLSRAGLYCPVGVGDAVSIARSPTQFSGERIRLPRSPFYDYGNLRNG